MLVPLPIVPSASPETDVILRTPPGGGPLWVGDHTGSGFACGGCGLVIAQDATRRDIKGPLVNAVLIVQCDRCQAFNRLGLGEA